MIVNLTFAEIYQAANWAVLNYLKINIFGGKAHEHGLKDDQKTWGYNIDGAIGEIVLAKHLNKFWSPTLGNLNQGDIGKEIEVRTTNYKNGNLIIHKTDKDESRFYLVITANAPEYVVAGWIYGKDGKHHKYWTDKGTKRFAYFVPQEDLNKL